MLQKSEIIVLGAIDVKSGLTYPDNLWTKVFGDKQPVPPDAAETLEVLLKEIDSPQAREVLRLHFVEGKSYAKIGETIGRSPERVRQIIAKSASVMRHPKKCGLPENIVCYGLSASRKIVDGNVEVCYECGKLITIDELVFIVPSSTTISYGSVMFRQTVKVCCSERCAQKSVARDIQRHQERITVLEEKIAAHRAEIGRMEDYIPAACSLEEGHEMLRNMDVPKMIHPLR